MPKIKIKPNELNRPTSNHELEQILRGYRCDGVVTVDRLPKDLPYGHSLVINLDKSDGTGTHWVCLVNYGTIEYYDSFGLPPPNRVMRFMKKLNPDRFGRVYNTTQIQPINSSKCGLYCCKYIIDRFNGRHPLDSIEDFNRITEPLEVRDDESISM